MIVWIWLNWQTNVIGYSFVGSGAMIVFVCMLISWYLFCLCFCFVFGWKKRIKNQIEKKWDPNEMKWGKEHSRQLKKNSFSSPNHRVPYQSCFTMKWNKHIFVRAVVWLFAGKFASAINSFLEPTVYLPFPWRFDIVLFWWYLNGERDYRQLIHKKKRIQNKSRNRQQTMIYFCMFQ